MHAPGRGEPWQCSIVFLAASPGQVAPIGGGKAPASDINAPMIIYKCYFRDPYLSETWITERKRVCFTRNLCIIKPRHANLLADHVASDFFALGWVPRMQKQGPPLRTESDRRFSIW